MEFTLLYPPILVLQLIFIFKNLSTVHISTNLITSINIFLSLQLMCNTYPKIILIHILRNSRHVFPVHIKFFSQVATIKTLYGIMISTRFLYDDNFKLNYLFACLSKYTISSLKVHHFKFLYTLH